ncbi:hypothetical protein DSLASN_00440 [Desulfoluna limicola]|uniref:Periplasmic heavy metal sensor n=1 Tax=Desulfoluna limicola TaxID=2810562 RepID=A0ABM7P9X8_9BACT|nr:hypothetical protein [Desulfoluna limicola]BCS94412.1 hypothetical protein DSLASN_00440 [Desulfoluna limicola]
MTQKKILILLAFSLCLNAGFLVTALVGHGPAEKEGKKHPPRAYSRHMELLKGLELKESTFQQAKELLDTFMEQRTTLIVKKLDHKLETIALLEKNPLLPRKDLEARHLEEKRIEEEISALGMDHTLDMRQILPPEKMALLYANAGKLIRGHRDRMVHWKDTAN